MKREIVRDRWHVRCRCLTCSFVMSRVCVRLSQLVTGADCPTDRRPSRATATRINLIVARLMIVVAYSWTPVDIDSEAHPTWNDRVQSCLRMCCNLVSRLIQSKVYRLLSGNCTAHRYLTSDMWSLIIMFICIYESIIYYIVHFLLLYYFFL